MKNKKNLPIDNKNISEDEYIYLIQSQPEIIRYIENPTEKNEIICCT